MAAVEKITTPTEKHGKPITEDCDFYSDIPFNLHNLVIFVK